MLAFLDPAGQQLIGHHIRFKWPRFGWCLGRISEWNNNPRRQVCKPLLKFTVFYPDDGSSGPHFLSLNNYNIHGDDDSPNHIWLLIKGDNDSRNHTRLLIKPCNSEHTSSEQAAVAQRVSLKCHCC